MIKKIISIILIIWLFYITGLLLDIKYNQAILYQQNNVIIQGEKIIFDEIRKIKKGVCI